MKKVIVLSLLILGFLFVISKISFAQWQQEVRQTNSPPELLNCATMDVVRNLMKEDPGYKQRQLELEDFTKNFKRNLGVKSGVVTIPVVVHIIYKTSEQNLSDAVIQSQIDVLNLDFRRFNIDTIDTPAPFKPLGGDVQIEFVLAKRDPLGNPTNGITRTQTTIDTFTMTSSAIKYTAQGGHDIWDRDKYCNIWVCNLKGYRGYSYYPGVPAAVDGTVIGYRFFGISNLHPLYNKGRTATHEIGHWFNLKHIWGDAECGDDLVDDTPTQQAFNYLCPGFPHVTCNNGPNGDMYSNYMDYTVDACLNIFTIGQSNRMNAALYGARSSLLTSNGGIPVIVDTLFTDGGESGFDKWTANLSWNTIAKFPKSGIKSFTDSPAGNYANNTNNSMTLKDAINVSSYDVLILSFWHRYNTQLRKDFCLVEVSSNNGMSWVVAKKYSGNLGALTQDEFDITSYANNTANMKIRFRLTSDKSTVADGWYVDDIIITGKSTGKSITDNKEINNNPIKYSLLQNYPNPFNPVTNIRYALPKNGFVKLVVFDALGREVATLVNESLKPGTYEATFDGSSLTSGVYFYKLTSDDFVETKKMLMIK